MKASSFPKIVILGLASFPSDVTDDQQPYKKSLSAAPNSVKFICLHVEFVPPSRKDLSS